MITLSWYALLSLTSGLISLLMLLAFASNPALRRSPGIGYLIALMACMILSQVGRLGFDGQPEIAAAKWLLLPDVLLFSLGPLLLLYLRRRLSDSPPSTQEGWHLIPAAIHLISIIAEVIWVSDKQLFDWFMRPDWQHYIYLFLLLALSYNAWYAYRIFHLLRQYEQEVDQRLSYASDSLRFFYLFVSIYFVDLMAGFSLLIWGWIQGEYGLGIFRFGIFWIFLAAWVFILAFYAMTKPEIFRVPLGKQPTKYPHSKLSDKEIRLLKTRVDLLMTSKQLHLKQDLRKQDVLAGLDISSADLSRVLNEGFGMNFFEYINVHRVQAFIALVESGQYQHLSLLGIAEQAGFNSKATFYKAFKEIIGQTPKAYFEQKL